jgi:ribosomal protein S18 acetylase RimI-like enzyme
MHNAKWQIRPAQPADREFVLNLTPRLTQGFTLPPGRTAEEVEQAEARTLAAALERPSADTALLIAERPDGHRGGMVYVQQPVDYFRQHPHAHVAILTVSAEWEGQGAGRALLEAAEGWARSQGVEMITLHVFVGNERARAVYERQGYAAETLRYVKWL